MAAIAPTRTLIKPGTVLYLWEAVGLADTCDPIAVGDFPEKSVQVTGTYGGGTLTIQGSNSNDPSAGTFDTLNDPSSTALSWTTGSRVEQVLENTVQIKPVLTGGDGTTDLDVFLVVKRGVERR